MAQRSQVAVLVAATIAPRYDVMHVGGWLDAPARLAASAQRMLGKEEQAPPLPSAIVATLCSRAALCIIAELWTRQRSAHGAHATAHQTPAARPPTRHRRPLWHRT
jgi:hypothetical protein